MSAEREGMSEPDFCYKCGTIVTFCECDRSITDDSEALEYFRERVTAMQEEIAALKAERDRAQEGRITEFVQTTPDDLQKAAALYDKEIAQEAATCTYPECVCPFDMGAKHKCFRGYPIAAQD